MKYLQFENTITSKIFEFADFNTNIDAKIWLKKLILCFWKKWFESNNLFFFVKNIQQLLLKKNHEILIMNCIYKINRYHMFLFIISDQIAMIINFYVVFCFIVKKTNSDYCWIFIQLKVLYMRLKFSSSIVFVINMKKALIFSIKMIFFNVNHLLCLWHINNNVLVNCKKAFDIKKKWNAFFIEWKAMIYLLCRHANRKAQLTEHYEALFRFWKMHCH